MGKHFIRVLYLSFLIVYLLNSLYGSSSTQALVGLLLLILVVQAFRGSSIFSLGVVLTLFFAGSISLYKHQATWQEWLLAFTDNSGLVALFIALPLFSFILNYDDYQAAIFKFSEKYIRSGTEFYILTAILSFIVSVILNLASLHFLYQLLKENAALHSNLNNFYRALVRGCLAGVFWAPNFMAVAVVLHYVKIPWISIVPLGLLLSICTLGLVAILFVISPNRQQAVAKKAHLGDGSEVPWRTLIKLLLVYVGMILVVALFNIFTELKILVIVPLIAIIYPLALAIIQQKIPKYLNQGQQYYQEKLITLKNEVLLFASVGFFSKAIEMSNVGKVLSHYLGLLDINTPSIMVFLIVMGMALLSALGIHPIISISTIASSMGPDSLGISALAFTYMLLLGYGVSVMSSPFSAITIMMAGVTQKRSIDVVPRLNVFYVLLQAVLFSLVAPLI